MSHAESIWVPVLNLDESGVEIPQAIQIEGQDLVLLRYGDRYVAMDRWCPHRDGDLAGGRIIGKAVKCPLHGFMFNVDTGRGINCSGFNVRVYEVRVDNRVLSVRFSRGPAARQDQVDPR